MDINYYLGEDLIFYLPLGKRTTSKEDNTFKIPSNNLGKVMCFIYSIKCDISLNIYVKQRLLMHVKLDLINIGILSSALYWEGTVRKKLGTLEEPKGGQCCWNSGKSSKEKKDKKTLYCAGLSQPRRMVWILFKEKQEIFKDN